MPLAGRRLSIELLFAVLNRFTGGTTARMVLVPSVLALGACLTGQAQTLGVNVVNSTYTASVNWWGYTIDGNNTFLSGGNSAVSASPTSNVFINQNPDLPGYDVVWGTADAGFLQNYVYADTGSFFGLNQACDASAGSDLLFCPSFSQTVTLNLGFNGFGDWGINTDCLVSLNDVTSDQTLWAYGWTAMGNTPYSFPYIDLETEYYGYASTFTVPVPTAFAGNDTYELVMNMVSSSNRDVESMQVQLSGLVAVPEPRPVALAGLAALLLVLRRVPGCVRPG